MVSLRTILSKKMPTGSQLEEPFDAMAFAHQQTEWYNNAEGHLDQEDGYDCPICRNKGYLRVVTEEGGIPNAWMRPCQCQKVRQSIRQMRRSGLQHIIQDYTFARFQATEPWQQKLKAAAQAYAQSLEGWFFFGGQSGSGKTHLCTAICRKALHQGKQVRYMLWRDDVSRIKAVANQGEEYNAAIAPYKHAELLYIDDLFKTGRSFDSRSPRPTTADVNVAFEILNYRYTAKLPTIVSSECVLDDLIQIDESLAGRIAERAKNLFELGPDRGKNYRLRG